MYVHTVNIYITHRSWEIHSKSLTFLTFSSSMLLTTSLAWTSITIKADKMVRWSLVSFPRTSVTRSASYMAINHWQDSRQAIYTVQHTIDTMWSKMYRNRKQHFDSSPPPHLLEHGLVVISNDAFLQRLWHLSSPGRLTASYHYLARPLQHPLCTGNLEQKGNFERVKSQYCFT